MMMTRQLLLGIAAIVLALSGWVVRQSNGNYVRAQANQLAAAAATDDANAKLAALKRFAGTHTGAAVTVVMTTAYNDAVAASVAAAAQSSTPNAALYAEAQAACASKANSLVQAQCNQKYLQTHGGGAAVVTPTTPAPILADYTFHFFSPILYFDLVTLLWVLAFIALVLLLIPVFRFHDWV